MTNKTDALRRYAQDPILGANRENKISCKHGEPMAALRMLMNNLHP
jgi:urocanate hydratase